MPLEFGNKTENGGKTPEGKLPASEFNQLVEQVNSNEKSLAKLIAAIFPFTISSFTGGNTYELGNTVNVVLNWMYDREIESQSINGESLSNEVRTKTIGGVSATVSYVLSARSGDMTATRSVTVSFRLKKYYGVSASDTLSNEQLISMSSTWAQRQQQATNFDCTGGKYPYYIIPSSIAEGIQFWIGGLRNSDWNSEIRDIINSAGYSENYTIFRLNSIQTGVLNIEIK